MENLTWQKVVVIVTVLICATAAEIFALSQGINGQIFSGYLLLMGSVAGVPVGAVLERKRIGA